MKKPLLIGVGALVFCAVNAGVTVLAMRMLAPPPAAAMASSEPDMESAVPEEVFYYNVQPEFVVNLQGKGRSSFLMIELAVSAFSEEVTALIDDHSPELRNSLLMLFSEQDGEALKSSEGKETLRQSAKAVVEDIVTRYHEPAQVHDVFITRLVIQ